MRLLGRNKTVTTTTVLRVSEAGFSDGLCEFNGIFAKVSNQTLGRTNHLFGRRFWSEQIEDDEYFKTAVVTFC